MKFTNLARASTLGVGLAVAATPASAETLTVGAHLPATTDAGLEIETISVDTLSGSKGAQLAYELKDALQKARAQNEPWFEVITIGATPVDAIIQGSAGIQSSVIELEPKGERKCAEKDNDNKCVRYKTTYYDCSRTEVSFYPDIEIIAQDGAILYAARDEMTRSKEACTDSNSQASIPEMSDGLVSGFAWRVRSALAPRFYESQYRILERRKGLEKADRKAFKNAVKLTKSDEDAACDAFKALEASNPQQVSVLFNVAMCHERNGEFALSLETLQRALAIEPQKLMALESVDRVEGWMRAADQLAARAEILNRRYADVEQSDEISEDGGPAEDG